MDIIFKTVFGSNLYGTNTPISDKDYKGIFLPSIKDVMTGKEGIYKTKSITNKKDMSSKSDATIVEESFYTIQKFLDLASSGQIGAIDMLFSPKDCWLKTSLIWNELYSNRHKFLSMQLGSFICYAKSQVNKYGFKDSRLFSFNHFNDFLKSKDPSTTLNDYPIDLINIERLDCNVKVAKKSGIVDTVEICGKKFQCTNKIKYVNEILEKIIYNYGKRAEQATKNENVDFKACSHALRACLQLQEIIKNEELCFPLSNREFLKEVKMGKYKYTEVEKMLEDSIEKTTKMLNMSSLPEKSNFNVEDFIIDVAYKKFNLR